MFASESEFGLRSVQTKGRENIIEQFLARANEQTTQHVTGSILMLPRQMTTQQQGISYALVYQAHTLDEQSLFAVMSYEDVFSFNGKQCFFDKRTSISTSQ